MKPSELRATRLRIGMTQRQLADLLGLTHVTISRWETGNIRVPQWVRLALDPLHAKSLASVRRSFVRGEPPYVYIQSERHLWTVGFYTPDGQWEPESDWHSIGEAATRVHYLNGGSDARGADTGAPGSGSVAVR